MEIQSNKYLFREVGDEDYDKVGSRHEESRQAVSDYTQTDDFDIEDCRGRLRENPLGMEKVVINGRGIQQGGGLFSKLITFVLPAKRKKEDEPEDEISRNTRCVSTQTEVSPLAIQAYELCCKVIQELVLENQVPAFSRDDVFEALCCYICEMLDKHDVIFNGMLRRCGVNDYRVFTSIANELFEVNTESKKPTITWGRVVSLFAFAVKLAQKYRESQEEDKINSVVHNLSYYISRHLLDFVGADGGWKGLVKQFPIPDSEEKQVKRVMFWSGLCVGLLATMYVSSFLSNQ